MKKLIPLPFISLLHDQLTQSPQFIQIIIGPRQVGKTTSILNYLETHHPNLHHFHSADKISGGVAWITEIWLKARAQGVLLVIDEIQKIENWGEIVKKLWDEEKRLKNPIPCILLGTSSLDLHVGMSESLTGRFQLINTYQWNFYESKLGHQLTFDEYMKFGGYPGSYELIKNPIQWRDYIRHSILDTVIEKDILLNHKVKSPSLFRQAFDLLISYPAQEISYTKLLGQLQDKGNTDLIKGYIKLFEGAFLLKALDKFSTNKIKKRTSSPKILPLCPAFSFINEMEDYSSEMKGHVFEAMVGAILVRTGFELYYWREGQHEVDFVLKFGKKIWAIEVKSGRRKKMEGLNQFLTNFPQGIPVIVTLENYQLLEDDPLSFLGITKTKERALG
jgi:predicted AAA+ superfamily ATPase